MAAPIVLRDDFDGVGVRKLAKATKDAAQALRLLALAEIADGGWRTDAAMRPWPPSWQRSVKRLIPARMPCFFSTRLAGWHVSPKLKVADTITLMPLPPRCPQLNPVENVWQFVRDKWVSNRVFHFHEEIVEHCCQAWNKLIDQPCIIMSIGMRDWAHEC